jgi:hypothetical protein
MRIHVIPVLLVLAACSGGGDRPTLPAFAVPETWAAAGIRADTVAAEDRFQYGAGVGQVVQYLYRPQDSALAPQALLVTLTYARVDWLALANEEGPPPGDTIWGSADSLVVVALPQSNPFLPGSPDAARFDSLALGLAQVRGLFQH